MENNFEVGREERLTEDEALEEARLVQIVADEVRAKRPEQLPGRPQQHDKTVQQDLLARESLSVSSEDYDQALQEIEGLKHLMEEETTTKQAFYKVGRALHTIARIPGMGLATMELLGLFPFINFEGIEKRKGRSVSLEDVKDQSVFIRLDRILKEKLTDAAKKLEDLKKRTVSGS